MIYRYIRFCAVQVHTALYSTGTYVYDIWVRTAPLMLLSV